MLKLPQVTLVAVTSIALPATLRAMSLSLQQAQFGAALLFSDQQPTELPTPAEWRKISQLSTRQAYSHFILRELADHITTEYALVIQWDGYVLNAAGWDTAFLDYDYIGAPWPQFADGMVVGNGGFSLRSSRLLKACQALPNSADAAEDIAICRTHRSALETEHGMRFAPTALAHRFAYERYGKQGGEFGFHGVFNMLLDLPASEFAALLAGLEPGTLGHKERQEIMLQALLRGRFRLMAQTLRR